MKTWHLFVAVAVAGGGWYVWTRHRAALLSLVGAGTAAPCKGCTDPAAAAPPEGGEPKPRVSTQDMIALSSERERTYRASWSKS